MTRNQHGQVEDNGLVLTLLSSERGGNKHTMKLAAANTEQEAQFFDAHKPTVFIAT